MGKRLEQQNNVEALNGDRNALKKEGRFFLVPTLSALLLLLLLLLLLCLFYRFTTHAVSS